LPSIAPSPAPLSPCRSLSPSSPSISLTLALCMCACIFFQQLMLDLLRRCMSDHCLPVQSRSPLAVTKQLQYLWQHLKGGHRLRRIRRRQHLRLGVSLRVAQWQCDPRHLPRSRSPLPAQPVDRVLGSSNAV
jgi:hypothetical protein